MSRLSSVLSVCAVVLGAASAWAEGVSPQDLLATGERVYRGACVGCHGERGAGDGKEVLNQTASPNDFTTGVYAFRSTPSGSLPLDSDLLASVRRGLRPTIDMPAFPYLTEQEVLGVVTYIKAFSARFRSEKPAEPVSPPPSAKLGSAEAGRAVFLGAGACFVCHGMTGRGDGPAAAGLAYSNGHRQGRPVRPPDFTRVADFKGGGRAEEIYRTISTGLDGTPMPSFNATLTAEQRWNVTAFILSLRPEAEATVSKGVVP